MTSRLTLTGRLALGIALLLFCCASLAAGTSYLLARGAIQRAQPEVEELDEIEAGARADVLERSSAESASRSIDAVAVASVLAVATTTLIGLLASRALAGRLLRPLRQIATFVERRTSANLTGRIELDVRDDDIDQLITNLNGMLDRLHDAFEGQRLFAAHASHELRTPLAIIRSNADITLADPDADHDQQRAALESIERAAARTQHLLDRLTLLARIDGHLTDTEPVAVDAVVRSAAMDAAEQFPSVSIHVDVERCGAVGDAHLLAIAVRNLLDNACRYNHPGGSVEITAAPAPATATVTTTIRNTGPILTAEQVAKLAEPFRRADAGEPGTGLGLTIATRIIEAHGGALALLANDGGGLTVVVRLPL